MNLLTPKWLAHGDIGEYRGTGTEEYTGILGNTEEYTAIRMLSAPEGSLNSVPMWSCGWKGRH